MPNSNEPSSSGDEPVFKRPRLPKSATEGLKYEETFLRQIPSAKQYEKSFMHRSVITHVLATSTDFIITASVDGHLKFWKKIHGEGVEFVKSYKCHLSKLLNKKLIKVLFRRIHSFGSQSQWKSIGHYLH
jgi:peptidylprolyl isomerase domain and WD repeat-containing protein 1